MFTGIIEEIGTINKIKIQNGKKFFSINSKMVQKTLKIGDSVACNGICLTIIDFDENQIIAEVMNETLYKTTAKLWKIGDKINLERAMKIGDRLDGHIVQGHIDCTAQIISVSLIANTLYLEINLEKNNAPLVIPQGSIAINGVSLTIAKLTNFSFSVAIIGHTYKETNLQFLKKGDLVNIEFDVIGKYILRSNYHNNISNTISEDYLLKNGF